MLAMLHRYAARPKTALPDFAGAAQCLIRWLALPKRRAGEQALQLLQSVPLTTQASVALIRFERDTLLLGITAHNVKVLARSAAPGAAAESQTKAGHLIP